MTHKQQIPATTVVHDIRSDLGDSGLMAKYGISRIELERLFKKLLDSKLISYEELYFGSSLYKTKIDMKSSRRHPRADIGVKVPIYDITTGTVGIVRDISVQGLRVAGIPVNVGDERTFQIPVDMFIAADPLLVIAECKWVTIKGQNRKYHVAGFELKELSASDATLLKDFVDFLLLSKSGEWQVLERSHE
jgi:PilZ domain